jgi:hypothetical protein
MASTTKNLTQGKQQWLAVYIKLERGLQAEFADFIGTSKEIDQSQILSLQIINE